VSILRGPHVACPPFFISLFYSAHTHFLSIVRGPHVACPPFFFSLSGFVSLLAVSLAENSFVVFLLAVITPRPLVPRGFHPAV
jgi:hypothetical protein